MKHFFFPFFFLIFYTSSQAQPEWNNWYFSGGNGLSFSGGDPVYTSGQITTEEGAAVISDKNGNLLFYTDGRFAWNKLHELMPDGAGLNAGAMGSSTQGCVIVPKTGDGLEYYIFTTDEEAKANGLQYSIVDMRLDGGKGDIAVKNVPLITPTSEKVTAVLHCDKKSYWIITHRYTSSDFYAFLANADGVSATPVVSHTNSFAPLTIEYGAGTMKSSPDGKKIAIAHHTTGLELADFDNSTGIISNAMSIWDKPFPGVTYGVEFSPNSSLLYATINFYRNAGDPAFYSGVFQFDVTLPDKNAIIASAIRVGNTPAGNLKATLQRGPNGKIYIANYTKDYLSIIHSPGIIGMGCNVEDIGFVLPNTGEFSLPNFINQYYGTKDSFTISGTGYCVNKNIQFNYTNTGDAVSLQWDFDDPLSGADNSSALASPTHHFTTARTYRVQLIKYGRCVNDTMIKEITITGLPVNLGADKNICTQSPVLLDPGSGTGNNYLWNDGSTSSTLMATFPGVYWVEVINITSGCIKRDSITLQLPPGGHCTIYVPSGFTPDRNGRNDLFKALGTGQVEVFSMKIFNRWGELIFNSSDKNIGWDGKYKGKDQPGGVYVYMIRYKEMSNQEMKLLKGTVTLIR
ncbi:MAG TPA: gliding motility-associated C-terminal domain-containing protein [Chitinophagaceae bacterium]|jgi:gliding motility-associated-like protein|nr:gliding motility-associated C-terminal domain-containing protein [Chitinophagaceae bacterium]